MCQPDCREVLFWEVGNKADQTDTGWEQTKKYWDNNTETAHRVLGPPPGPLGWRRNGRGRRWERADWEENRDDWHQGDKMERSEEPSQPQLHIPVLLQLFSKACPTPPCLSPLPTPMKKAMGRWQEENTQPPCTAGGLSLAPSQGGDARTQRRKSKVPRGAGNASRWPTPNPKAVGGQGKRGGLSTPRE